MSGLSPVFAFHTGAMQQDILHSYVFTATTKNVQSVQARGSTAGRGRVQCMNSAAGIIVSQRSDSGVGLYRQKVSNFVVALSWHLPLCLLCVWNLFLILCSFVSAACLKHHQPAHSLTVNPMGDHLMYSHIVEGFLWPSSHISVYATVYYVYSVYYIIFVQH